MPWTYIFASARADVKLIYLPTISSLSNLLMSLFLQDCNLLDQNSCQISVIYSRDLYLVNRSIFFYPIASAFVEKELQSFE